MADKKRKSEFDDKITQSIYLPIKPLVDFVDYETLSSQHTKMAELFNSPMILWVIIWLKETFLFIITKITFQQDGTPMFLQIVLIKHGILLKRFLGKEI